MPTPDTAAMLNLPTELRHYRPLALDFETYWDKDLTLRKLNYTDYVNHPKFFIWGVSLKYLDSTEPARFYNHAEMLPVLSGLEWGATNLISHNGHFDPYILHRKFDIHPAFYSDTMSMSRAIMQGETRNSVDALAKHFELGHKLKFLDFTKGKLALTPNEWSLVADGCNNDVELTGEFYSIFAPLLPWREHRLINLTLRMFNRPRLVVNRDLAQEALDEELQERAQLIARTNYTKDQLSGNDSFAAILRDLGVDPPMKWGKPAADGTPRKIYALAKTDPGFVELLESSDPAIAALAEARQAIQSTLAVTRAERLLREADRGELPVCYLYCGAHTWRMSGGNKTNLQNLTRSSKLRRAIEAAHGYVLPVRDSSQIEVRTLYAIADQNDRLEIFRAKRDPYVEMAEAIFQEQIELTLDENGELTPATPRGKLLRFIGKCVVLGCGYQMGWRHFQYSLSIGAIGGKAHKLTDEEAQHAVTGYRAQNPRVVAAWDEGRALLAHLVNGYGQYTSWLHGVVADADTKRLYLPGGTWLQYPKLRYDPTQHQFVYTTYRGDRKIYGGKVIENIVQGAARNLILENALDIDDAGYPIVMTTHDELVACVPETQADEALAHMAKVMETSPSWLPHIPLASTGGYARNYSK